MILPSAEPDYLLEKYQKIKEPLNKTTFRSLPIPDMRLLWKNAVDELNEIAHEITLSNEIDVYHILYTKKIPALKEIIV